MIETVKAAAVFGAGSMGGGIAAQFANANVPVLLFDKPGLAEGGVERQLKTGGFMHPSRAKLVRPCSVEDDIARVAEADWIVEAVVEDLAVKRDLYARIDAARKPGSLVSSNTSTIPLARLIEGARPAFAESFVITHFFNPPRTMPLVEVVAAPGSAKAAARVRTASEEILGKTVLDCRDAPGFIANRIGCFWIAMTIIEALNVNDFSIEEADAIASRPFHIPASGVFALLDLIGVDLVPHVWGSLVRQLPDDDRLSRYDLTENALMRRMIEAGRLGRKSGAGFYRMTKSGGGRSLEVLDPASFAYRSERKRPKYGADLKALCETGDAAGRFAWRVLSRVVLYASEVAPEIAASAADIDLGMRLGYGWEEGPFEIADRVGARWIADRLSAEGERLPPLLDRARADGGFYREGRRVISTAPPFELRQAIDPAKPLVALKRSVVFENAGAVLSDIGDGVLCFEHKTKMNIYDESVFAAIGAALVETPKAFRALVIGNDHPRAFSCGADLGFFLGRMRAGDYTGIDAFLISGQEQFLALKYAPFPVVGAAHGLALGGGCETLLHMHEVVAHSELSAGLPESTLGILPGWGGCTQMILRWRNKDGVAKGPVAALGEPFSIILGGRFSGTALNAVDMGILRPTDPIVMNRAQTLKRAKARAIERAVAGAGSRDPEVLFLPGISGKASLMSAAHSQAALGRLSANDLAVAEALATILTGGATDPLTPMTERHVMALEREATIALARRPATFERIEHMLATGKPLKN
jgi:3-hydroxyacyl-CoA dehydrogenase